MDEGKILALAVAICFGLNPVLLRLGFARGGVVDAALILGLAISVLLYLAFLPLAGGLHLELVTLPVLGAFILGGLFGTGIGRRWLFVAIESIGASPAVAIKNGAPLISTVLAIFLFGEQVTLTDWLAIGGIIGGITLVTWQSGAGWRQMLNAGILAAFGAAVSYGIRPLFLKFGLEQADLPVTAALIGAVAALGYALAMARPRSRTLPAIDRRPLAFFAAAGVLQGLGFLALNFALAADQVSTVYPITSSGPIFTLGFTWLLLRGTDRLTWRITAGVLGVTAGVIML